MAKTAEEKLDDILEQIVKDESKSKAERELAEHMLKVKLPKEKVT